MGVSDVHYVRFEHMRVFYSSKWADVRRGFWPAGFYINLVLSCSEILVGSKLCSSSVFCAVNTYLLNKSYTIAGDFCEMHTQTFYDCSMYV